MRRSVFCGSALRTVVFPSQEIVRNADPTQSRKAIGYLRELLKSGSVLHDCFTI